jgi:chemotaxis family two-component system response regulator PixG
MLGKEIYSEHLNDDKISQIKLRIFTQMLVEKERVGLAFQLSQLQSNLFKGRLDIESPSGLNWSLYFCLGRLVWQAGGAYPLEHWNRLLSQYSPKIDELSEINGKNSKFNGYTVLEKLLQQGKSEYSQIVALVKNALVEVLFDILQDEYCLKDKQPNRQLSFTVDSSDCIKNVFTLFRTDKSLTEAMQQWELWQKMKLTPYSPNLVPIIQRPEQLQQNLKNSRDTYWKLKKLVDGKHTLRSLALELRQPLPNLTLFFLQYVNSGIMSFLDFKKNVKDTPKPQSIDRLIPLVICIDDSSTVCAQVKQIVTGKGCRFLEIQDAVKAIPTLLKIKPDLIFLDLVMPIVNGYELCAQIRRISILQNIPIVILTGKNGLVDRARAKIVGANDFLAKPVNQERVSSILYKYALAKSQLS